VCAAAITPHREDGHEADVGAMLDLIDFLCKAGVDAICLLGSTGEFLNIPFADRIRLVHLGVKRSRVPLLAGISHSTLDGAVELASEAVGSGAAGLLLMPPFFFRYDQNDILEFYTRFREQVPKRVPVMLYNIPQFSNGIAIETAARLLETGLYSGIKDSSGDAAYFEQLLALRREHEFTLLCGNDKLARWSRASGADGVVSGCACAVPELVAALYREPTDQLEAWLNQFITHIECFPTPVGVKVAASLRKIKTGPLAVPLDPRKTAMLEEFKTWFTVFLKTIPAR
jgi:dihydrodipicolinate synthase/N-acetylneuraminate lyase